MPANIAIPFFLPLKSGWRGEGEKALSFGNAFPV